MMADIALVICSIDQLRMSYKPDSSYEVLRNTIASTTRPEQTIMIMILLPAHRGAVHAATDC